MTQDAFTPNGQELWDFAGHLQLNCSIRSMVRVAPPASLKEDTHTLLHSLGSGCLVPSMGAAKQTGLVLGREGWLGRSSLGKPLLWVVGLSSLLWVFTPTSWTVFGNCFELGGN